MKGNKTHRCWFHTIPNSMDGMHAVMLFHFIFISTAHQVALSIKGATIQQHFAIRPRQVN